MNRLYIFASLVISIASAYLYHQHAVDSAYSGGYENGSHDKQVELTGKYQKAYIDQFEYYRNKERDAANKFAEIDEEHTQEMFDAQEIIDGIIGDVRAGRRRLFVTASNKSRDGSVSGSGSAAGMGDEKARCELDRDSAEEILRLTERGDKAIIQLTACQDYARTAQELCR